MTKEAIAETLENIARLLDLKGENVFKIRAYQTAARAVETYAGNLEETARADRLDEVEGIGEAIAEEDHRTRHHRPAGVLRGTQKRVPADAVRVVRHQRPRGQEDQGAARKTQEFPRSPNSKRPPATAAWPACPVSEKRPPKISSPTSSSASATRRFTGWATWPEPALRLAEELRGHPAVLRASEGGSFRRRKEVVRDLDFVASTNDAGGGGRVLRHAAGRGGNHCQRDRRRCPCV